MMMLRKRYGWPLLLLPLACTPAAQSAAVTQPSAGTSASAHKTTATAPTTGSSGSTARSNADSGTTGAAGSADTSSGDTSSVTAGTANADPDATQTAAAPTPTPSQPAAGAPNKIAVGQPPKAPITIALPAGPEAKLLDKLVPASKRIITTAALTKLTLSTDDDLNVFVDNGRQRATLDLTADMIKNARHTRDTAGQPLIQILLSDPLRCHAVQTFETENVPTRLVLAKLENVAALAELKAKHPFLAAQGFARAALLAPDLEEAWVNLAKALMLAGKQRDAVAAMGPLMRKQPMQAYHTLVATPELTQLRNAPEVAALRAARPGKATLSLQGGKLQAFKLAYSPSKRSIAIIRSGSSWGTCHFHDELQVYDQKTGTLRFELPVIGWGETDGGDGCSGVLSGKQSHVSKRLKMLNGWLRDMGFSPSLRFKDVAISKKEGDKEDRHQGKVPHSGIKIDIRNHHTNGFVAKVLRGKAAIGSHQASTSSDLWRTYVFDWMVYDPLSRVVAANVSLVVSEGCGSGPESAGLVIPLKP